MAARDAGVDAANLAIGHQFGFFERLLDALHGGVNIDHHAALESVAGSNPKARQLELTIEQYFGDHHHHFAGPDVEPDNQIFVFFGHSL